MRPKKRDRAASDEPKHQTEPAQPDHDVFLDAFQLPTQIYRYMVLPRQHTVPPLFLNRTARYMTGRCKRKANTRDNFKVDSLLAKAEAEFKKQQTHSYKQDYMNLTFSGYYDKENTEAKNVEVEVRLLKSCYMKRKDIVSPEIEIPIGKVTLPCNPESTELLTAESITIPSDNFCVNGTQNVKQFSLRLHVANSRKPAAGSTSRPTTRSRDSNGSDLENQDPPPKKRLRRSSEDRSTRSGGEGRARGDKSKSQSDVLSYQSDLIIYDKYRRCMLTDGDYDVALEEVKSSRSILAGKHSSWETVSEGKVAHLMDIFGKRPVVKFKLAWISSPLQEIVSLKSETSCDEIICNNRIGGRIFDFKGATRAERATQKDADSPSKRPKRIFYQFLFNNTTRQQTESSCDDCRCPWCSLNCLHLQSLLGHLRCCHARFNFTYVEHPKGVRIDVSLNECYDGSYVGNPQDLQSYVGYAFGRNGPVRRIPVTLVLFHRSKKSTSGLCDFNYTENEGQSNRQLVHGHNRLYFHSSTCQPIRPCEIEMDSEDETDPEWLRQKTQNMIDEFTDVNEGEKELMKMWNLHVMEHNYIGDCRVTTACESFVREMGSEIVHKNLGRNLILHLVNLCDFGLIRPEIIYRIAVQFFRLRRQLEDSGPSADAVEPGPSSASS